MQETIKRRGDLGGGTSELHSSRRKATLSNTSSQDIIWLVTAYGSTKHTAEISAELPPDLNEIARDRK